MDFSWPKVLPNDRFVVVVERPISHIEVAYLFQLYQPLVGVDAAALYQTLLLEIPERHNCSSVSPHRWLMSLTGDSLDRIVRAREKLEAVGLMRTRKQEREGERCFEYTLLPPLSPAEFFAQDVLRIMLFNKVGKTGYEKLRARFAAEPSVQETLNGSFVEVTKSFDEVFANLTMQELVSFAGSETAVSIEQAHQAYPVYSVKHPSRERVTLKLSLDWELLAAMLPRSVNKEKAMTSDVRETLKQLAFLYRLDSLQLGRFLNEPYIYTDDQQIDPAKLRRLVEEWYDRQVGMPIRLRAKEESEPGSFPFEHVDAVAPSADGRANDSAAADAPSPEAPSPHGPVQTGGRAGHESGEEDAGAGNGAKLDKAELHRQALKNLSPFTLLEYYQDGGKVSSADQKIVEELLYSYQLPPEVVNVLLEYVMLTHDKQLPRALIMKIAAHWKRLKIETAEEAQAQAKRLFEMQKKGKKRKKGAGERTSATASKKELPEWIVKQAENEKRERSAANKAETVQPSTEKERKALELLRALGEIE
ncbi:replication initiation membrane attachment protein DnaB [Bacillaceae bacterium]